MMEHITETEVRDWFRRTSPESWQAPADTDVQDIAELLNRYLDHPSDQEDGRGFSDRCKNARLAACVLLTEIPAMLSLARASALQASREEIEGHISLAAVANLEQLAATLRALRPIFNAKLFQPVDPDPPRVNNRWHGLARLLASQAGGAWEKAGVGKVGFGNNEEAPVVAFVQAALCRMGDGREKGAIVKVLQKWSKAGARSG
jgi:hypothetical protein